VGWVLITWERESKGVQPVTLMKLVPVLTWPWYMKLILLDYFLNYLDWGCCIYITLFLAIEAGTWTAA
jgi:hypothetical protein